MLLRHLPLLLARGIARDFLSVGDRTVTFCREVFGLPTTETRQSAPVRWAVSLVPKLFQQQHLFGLVEIAGFQAIEINSTGVFRGVPNGLIFTGRFLYVHYRLYALAHDVVYSQFDAGTIRKRIADDRRSRRAGYGGIRKSQTVRCLHCRSAYAEPLFLFHRPTALLWDRVSYELIPRIHPRGFFGRHKMATTNTRINPGGIRQDDTPGNVKMMGINQMRESGVDYSIPRTFELTFRLT